MSLIFNAMGSPKLGVTLSQKCNEVLLLVAMWSEDETLIDNFLLSGKEVDVVCIWDGLIN